MSRDKGARGEREWAEVCRAGGMAEACRGRQYRGGADSPDVSGTGCFHFEVKRNEALRLYPAMEQAIEDCPVGKVPVVAHRKSRKDWLVVLRAEDFFKLIGEREEV